MRVGSVWFPSNQTIGPRALGEQLEALELRLRQHTKNHREDKQGAKAAHAGAASLGWLIRRFVASLVW